jgi:hypothetical protein
MPIQVKARDVAKNFNDKTVSNVESLVAQEIGDVKAAFTRLLRETEKAVDLHFDTQEKRGAPPYPEARERYGRRYRVDYEATVYVHVREEKDRAVLENGQVAARLTEKISTLLSDAGFSVDVRQLGSHIELKISDPNYEPINEPELADSIFEERIKSDE